MSIFANFGRKRFAAGDMAHLSSPPPPYANRHNIMKTKRPGPIVQYVKLGLFAKHANLL